MSIRAEIDKALKYDAIDEAEKVFGKNSKESQAVVLANFLDNNKKKEILLKATGDTVFSNEIEDYLRIIKGIGFEMVFKEKFFRKIDNKKDTLYAFWHDEFGIFLHFDTYNNKIVNGGRFHYNVLLKYNLKNIHNYTSTGGFHKRSVHDLCYYDKDGNLQDVRDRFDKIPDSYETTEECKKHNKKLYDTYYGVFIGNHDAREGVKHHITGLNENGKLLSQWVEPDLFSLCTGEDEDRNKESLRRLAMLPENVKQKICYYKIVADHKRLGA